MIQQKIKLTGRNTAHKGTRVFIPTIFSLLLTITLSITCFTLWARAQSRDRAVVYTYYTNIEVQYGDTLWDIASEYYDSSYESREEYIHEVMTINRMLEPDITAGSYLIVPYRSTEYLP